MCSGSKEVPVSFQPGRKEFRQQLVEWSLCAGGQPAREGWSPAAYVAVEEPKLSADSGPCGACVTALSLPGFAGSEMSHELEFDRHVVRRFSPVRRHSESLLAISSQRVERRWAHRHAPVKVDRAVGGATQLSRTKEETAVVDQVQFEYLAGLSRNGFAECLGASLGQAGMGRR